MVFGIVGPTASGKSSIGHKLAKSGKFYIINSDSQQTYSYLPTLSSMPDDLTDHALYGVFDLPQSERFNVVNWCKMLEEEIARARQLSKIPILIGGTGFYFKVLQDGIVDLPAIDDEIIKYVSSLSDEELYNLASSNEREKFKDRRRLEKVIGIFLQTNERAEVFYDKLSQKYKLNGLFLYSLIPAKEVLWANIEQRLCQDLDKMIAEVKIFNDKFGARNEIQMIGYKEIIEYLNGELSSNALFDKMLFKTRQYSKRQKTYIRNCLKIDRAFTEKDALYDFISELK